MDERQPESDYETVRVPAELRDRVDALYREYRGYDPASFQEALSLVSDVAAGRLAPEESATTHTGGRATDDRERSPTDSSTAPAPPKAPSLPTASAPRAETDDDRLRAIDEVFPRDWDADETVRTYLPRIVDAYLDEDGHAAHEERVEAAFSTVAADTGVSPTDLRETLVTRLYGGAGLSSELSEEFFLEALGGIEEIDERPPTGVRSAASDGGVAAESGEFSVESLLTEDDADPTADCERCGTRTAVDDLETVIGPDDGSTVRLLCPACVREV